MKKNGGYRWLGVYDVKKADGIVTNVAWSGPGAPEYPTFPIDKSLTAAAVSSGEIVNVGESEDPNAFNETLRSF